MNIWFSSAAIATIGFIIFETSSGDYWGKNYYSQTSGASGGDSFCENSGEDAFGVQTPTVMRAFGMPSSTVATL